jgi:hypothetical protein
LSFVSNDEYSLESVFTHRPWVKVTIMLTLNQRNLELVYRSMYQ